MKPEGFLVMGVAGSGKTTVGKALAERLGWDFYDADHFHTPENIAKMRAGIPLTDSDRLPWLVMLHNRLLSTLKVGRHPVLACSALKEKYRAQLLDGLEGITIIYLKGSFDLIFSRMSDREGHYMKPGMLRSQFDELEEPKDAIVLDIQMSPEEMVDTIMKKYRRGL